MIRFEFGMKKDEKEKRKVNKEVIGRFRICQAHKL